VLWTFLTSLLQALAGWFKTKSDDQLIELGEKRNQENVDKTETEAVAKTKEIVQEVRSLDDSSLDSQLHEFTRKD
jgi:hypothetical protein